MSNQSKLLLLASIIGTFLAIYSIMETNKNFSSLPDNIIATVNDKIIPSDKYQTIINLIQNDKRDELTKADREMALDRIIEEELLVQYAYKNGFLEADDLLRKSIVRSVVDSIVEQALSVVPAEQDLLKFYEVNRQTFAIDEKYRVVILSSQNRSDIDEGKVIWQSNYDLTLLRQTFKSIDRLDIPTGFISKIRLGTLIGPLLRDKVLSLQVGETSQTLKTIYGYSIVTLVDKKDRVIPEFKEISEIVLQEYKRQQREEILEELLKDLKRQSDIKINEGFTN
ncbi:MAG: SurA N-terminal domain-containing protein [Gammaproteobacteria bacterium]|nr:SurA N-terminal domain-containing protein [Gammaproteobacteria bacterium]